MESLKKLCSTYVSRLGNPGNPRVSPACILAWKTWKPWKPWKPLQKPTRYLALETMETHAGAQNYCMSGLWNPGNPLQETSRCVSDPPMETPNTEAEFLYEIQTSLKSFPPCNSKSPLQLCLEISISSSSQNLLQFLEVSHVYIIKEKGGKPDRKPHPLPYSFRNPYRNLKSESSQDYAQKPQRNCTFINSASGRFECGGWHC